MHYFDVYERHLSKYRGKEIVMVEIGIYQGGSLQMWKEYFGDKAKIYGIDIDPRCKELEEENIEIFIGSQADRKFIRDLKSKIPKIDILLDDGGHTMRQQIVTYEELFSHVKTDGVYLCEDLHTSYWLAWGGGYRRRGTFIEYSKRFIDQLNAYHSRQWMFKPNEFTKNAGSIHYYDSMLVVEKKDVTPPTKQTTGTPSFEWAQPQKGFKGFMAELKYHIIKGINLVLRFFRIRSVFTTKVNSTK